MITGTQFFTSRAKAVEYFAAKEGDDAAQYVRDAVNEGRIAIGVKPLTVPGEKLILIDNGARYGIEKS